MIRFIIVLLVLIAILYMLQLRSKNSTIAKSSYRKVIIIIIITGILVLIATSGRYLLPQALQLFKIGLPFLTKLIGI